MRTLKLKKGYNINVSGASRAEIKESSSPERVAIRPTEFQGIKPSLKVEESQEVLVGTPIFSDRDNSSLVVTSPVSGKVSRIIRGEKRIIEAVIVQNDHQYKKLDQDAFLNIKNVRTKDKIVELLLRSGLFPLIKQRPFNVVANPAESPRDIFISAYQTSPLAPDLNNILSGNEKYLQKGINILSNLTTGDVHFTTADPADNQYIPYFQKLKNVVLHQVSGRHPAGNVGVHIHHFKPLRNSEDRVWTLSFQAVIQIGKFFSTGEINSKIVVAVAGAEAKYNCYYRAIVGSSLSDLGIKDLSSDFRYISGDLLSGTNITQTPYLGYYDNLITIIPETNRAQFLGWMRPGLKVESYSRSFLSKIMKKVNLNIDTNQNGGVRAFIANDLYQEVLPMDIYVSFLMKSILAEDISEMEALGLFELAEEDVALCEYICPSKIDFQKTLRKGLKMLQKELS